MVRRTWSNHTWSSLGIDCMLCSGPAVAKEMPAFSLRLVLHRTVLHFSVHLCDKLPLRRHAMAFHQRQRFSPPTQICLCVLQCCSVMKSQETTGRQDSEDIRATTNWPLTSNGPFYLPRRNHRNHVRVL